MAGTIVTDRIESDATYNSKIELVSPVLVSNTFAVKSTGGTGVFNIVGANTNTDRTFTLPDNTGTIVASGTTPALNGIAFPATQAASSNANTLDDYEEGTFNPTISGWTGTYTTQFGHYTKIGNLVYCFGCIITNGGTGTFSGSFPDLSGLPIPAGLVGSAAKGMWFVVAGTTGLTSSETASGPLDGPNSGGTAAFPNHIITGGNVNNFPSTKLNASAAVQMRFFITYTT
jgi:hypothetical protein